MLLPGPDRGASTDNDGAFYFEGLTAGKYSLRCSHIGFALHEEKVQLARGTTRQLRIRLRETVVDLGSVSISGTRSTGLLRNTPQPVSVVGAERIMRQAQVSVPDAIAASLWGTKRFLRCDSSSVPAKL